MAFKQGDHLAHLQGVKKVLENPKDMYGPFLWQEDIFKKEKGVYVPAGRIILPMSVEGRDSEKYPNRRAIAFTAFCKAYFEGEDATPEGCNHFSDWFPNGKADGIESYTGEMSLTSDINTRNPYLAVRAHVENVLHSLDELRVSAEERGLDLPGLVRRLFVEY